MDDWSPIFQGTSEAARSLAIHLEAAGVHSFVASQESSMLSEAGYREVWSAVLVAPDQVARASDLVLQWSALQPQRVSELTVRLSRIVAVSALPPLAWLAAWWSKPGLVPAPGAGWLILLFFASLIVVGRLEHRRHEHEHIRPPG